MGQGRDREGEDLLGVFSTRVSATNQNPLDGSALCIFHLDALDRRIDSIRDLCYTQDGMLEDGREVAYIEYEVKSSCANLLRVCTQDIDISQNGHVSCILSVVRLPWKIAL